MIHKVNQVQLNSLLSGVMVPATSAYFVGSFEEKFSIGKLTLSVKIGKNRKLLTGKMIQDGYLLSQISSGHYLLRFVPNNPQKAKSLQQQK